jgi:hypothetical protein
METQETRINNGVNEIKTDKFIYKHNDKFNIVFDLYTDFEKFKIHLNTYSFSPGGGAIRGWDKYSKDIENTTLNSDEYFIGVNMTNEGYRQNYIFYTNYGNIIDVCIRSQEGGWLILTNYIVIKNNRKLNLEQINLLNFIIQPDKYEINCDHVSSSYINAIINRVIYNYNEPKHEEPKREEPKREESKREEPKREEPKREESKREEPKRENEEAERKELCTKYIAILKSKYPRIINGSSMAKWVKGKDRDSNEYKQVIKAYKYVHQDNNCSDFKKDGKYRKKKSKSRKRKNSK